MAAALSNDGESAMQPFVAYATKGCPRLFASGYTVAAQRFPLAHMTSHNAVGVVSISESAPNALEHAVHRASRNGVVESSNGFPACEAAATRRVALRISPGLGWRPMPPGRVIAADVQPAMLAKVRRRVAQAGVQDRVELHVCGREHIGLSARVDFVLAFWMVHKVPNAVALFAEMHEALNPDGRLLLVEPKFHVGRRDFEKEVGAALEAKLKLLARPSVRLSHAAFLAK